MPTLLTFGDSNTHGTCPIVAEGDYRRLDAETRCAAIENWHNNKGPDGIQSYWEQKNLSSMNGLPTGLKLNKD